MFEQFSKPALAAVLGAPQEARQCGRAELDVPDLLRATLRWDTVRDALRELGVDLDAIVDDGQGKTGGIDVRNPIPYSASARAVLYRAIELRLHFNLPQVTLGVLMAALLDDMGVRGTALHTDMTDVDQVRSVLVGLSDPPAHDLKVAGHRVHLSRHAPSN